MEAKYEMGSEAVLRMHRFLSGETEQIESGIVPVRFSSMKSIQTLDET